jgi:hypothetical protein
VIKRRWIRSSVGNPKSDWDSVREAVEVFVRRLAEPAYDIVIPSEWEGRGTTCRCDSPRSSLQPIAGRDPPR